MLILLAANSAAGEVCTSTGSGSWGPLDTTSGGLAWSDCTPTADDNFIVYLGHTIEIVDDLLLTTGDITVRAAGRIDADVAAQGRGLTIRVGDGNFDAFDGSTLYMRGAYVPANTASPSLTGTQDPVGATLGDRIELSVDGDPSLVSTHYTTDAFADDPHLDAYLHKIDQLIEGGDVVLLEFFDPDPDVKVSADSMTRYRIDSVKCATCGAANASDADPGEVGEIVVSLRQFEEADHVGLPVTTQDVLFGTLAVAADKGDRCIEVDAGTFVPSSIDLHHHRVGWWISFEKGGAIDPLDSYAIMRGFDSTSVLQPGANDVICIMDDRGIRTAHDLSPGKNEFAIHRGWIPGDAFRVLVPVVLTRDVASSTKSAVAVRWTGTVDIRGVLFDKLARVEIGSNNLPGSNGGSTLVNGTELTVFDCEATGGDCFLDFGRQGPVDYSGFVGAGGGTCDDSAPPECEEPANDGDVHFFTIREVPPAANSYPITIRGMHIRAARDDSLFVATSFPAPDTHLTVDRFVTQGGVSALWGADSGNIIDCQAGAPCYWDVSRIVNVAGSIDDCSPAFAHFHATLGAEGWVTDLFNAGSSASQFGSVSIPGTVPQPFYRKAISLGVGGQATCGSHLGWVFPSRGEEIAFVDGWSETPQVRFGHFAGRTEWVKRALMRRTRIGAARTAHATDLVPIIEDVALIDLDGHERRLDLTFGGQGDYLYMTVADTATKASYFADNFLGALAENEQDAVILNTLGTQTVGGILIANWPGQSGHYAYDTALSGHWARHRQGGWCWFDNTAGDALEDRIDSLVDNNASLTEAMIVRGVEPDFVNEAGGDMYAPGYSHAHDCGVSRPVGVCEPTFGTLRYKLAWQQFCMGASVQCSDHRDNDGDGRIDFDGAGVGGADPDCIAPWQVSESPFGCGLGWEILLLVPPLMWLHGRSRLRSASGRMGRS